MANRRVAIVRTVKIDGKWKYLSPVVSAKGRVSNEFVMLAGKQTRVTGGVYYISWYAGQKKQFKRCGASLIEATIEKDRQEKVLAAQAVGLEVKTNNPKARLTILDTMDQYKEDLRLLNRRPETVEAYRLVFDGFNASCKKHFLDQIDRTDLLRFADALRKEGLSPRTVSNRWHAIHAYLKHFGITGLTKRKDAPRYVEEEAEAYSKEDMQDLFSVCTAEQKLLYSFYLKTGFRMQEVMFLQCSDINFKGLTVSVTAKPKHDFIPKAYEVRTIPLDKGLAEALQARCRDRKSTDLVFPTKTGQPNWKQLQALKRIINRMKPGTPTDYDNAAAYDPKDATVTYKAEDFWLHKFRATYATWHLQAGVDVRTVSKLLGHKKLETTLRYLQAARGTAISAKLNETFADI